MEPIHKFNNGRGAMLCNKCRTIISTGPKTEELYCEKCKPKQETLKEFAERLYPILLEDDWDKNKQYRDEWIEGAKWQQEKSYSEEEVIELLQKALTHQDDGEIGSLVTAQGEIRPANFHSWFNQFKNKQDYEKHTRITNRQTK
jgi:hypothetical protein